MDITDKELERYLIHKEQFSKLSKENKQLYYNLKKRIARKTIDINEVNKIWKGK